jgi:hypothetical protein
MGETARYKNLSSVSWVNSTWVIALMLTVAFIVAVAALNPGLNVFWPIFIALWVLLFILMYPYYHYRQAGGFIMRIPPRFHFKKAVFRKE